MGGGEGVWRWEKREIMYLSLHRHHQNDSCIKMGSDESHFNVSLTVRDKVTRQCHAQTTTFQREREAKADLNRSPSAYLPLGQTGPQVSRPCSTPSCLQRSWDRDPKPRECGQQEGGELYT